ncbi:LysR family substrate-binding domain-containing protein [Serratia marcescens]|uniref:LysR family substrate-binding domain-containing protein n=1 Tax=Serratia marcescens TaxID=615 RepID=UPI001E4E636C|nr:LysR family substrate-binding domain-containing protein [Serratia marcescens]
MMASTSSGRLQKSRPERITNTGTVVKAVADPLSALAEEPWILFPEQEGPGLYRSIIEACEKEGFMPEVVQRAVQMETIVGLVASGLGVSLVPEFMQKSGWVNVSFCPLSGEQIPYQVALIHKPENTNPYVADFVRNAVPLQPYVPT